MKSEKPCALLAHKTNPIPGRNQTKIKPIQTKKMRAGLFNPFPMTNSVSFANYRPCHSPSPGGEGRGEGELKTYLKFTIRIHRFCDLPTFISAHPTRAGQAYIKSDQAGSRQINPSRKKNT
jgi:hypothetical protein